MVESKSEVPEAGLDTELIAGVRSLSENERKQYQKLSVSVQDTFIDILGQNLQSLNGVVENEEFQSIVGAVAIGITFLIGDLENDPTISQKIITLLYTKVQVLQMDFVEKFRTGSLAFMRPPEGSKLN